jgi:hypothetical protein
MFHVEHFPSFATWAPNLETHSDLLKCCALSVQCSTWNIEEEPNSIWQIRIFAPRGTFWGKTVYSEPLALKRTCRISSDVPRGTITALQREIVGVFHFFQMIPGKREKLRALQSR